MRFWVAKIAPALEPQVEKQPVQSHVPYLAGRLRAALAAATVFWQLPQAALPLAALP